MLNVTFYKCDYGYYSFQCRDHTGDEKVCAVASALCMALVGTCEKFIDGLKIKFSSKGSGHIDFELEPFSEPEMQREVDTVFSTVIVGLRQVEKQWPDRIKIELIRD